MKFTIKMELIQYIKTHVVEILGAIFAIGYLILSIRLNWWLWILGFITSAFYVYVYFETKFYADMALQFYYLGISFYGLWHWRNRADNTNKPPAISYINLNQIFYLAIITLVIFVVISYILVNYTDSPVPYADSFTTAASITATWMLAKKIIEHWLVWIIVDALSMGLYFYREMYPTFVLFGIYTTMAIYGYLAWKKEYKVEQFQLQKKLF